MGMHFGLLAVKTDVPALKQAFSEVWADFEIVDSASDFKTPEAFWAWMRDNERFVSAADWSPDQPGRQTVALYQDGPWAVLFDASFTLASDEDALPVLSQRFGTALSFVIQTTSGCSYFWCYENGVLRRSLFTEDGPTEVTGDPLEQEAGIDIANYYMDETEELMAAFGLAPLDQLPTNSAVALAIVDRTDYSDLIPPDKRAKPAQTRKSKPWWKLW